MKKIFSVLGSLVFAFSGFAANAQDSTAQNSLLWQISGKGLSKPSYLFGTIHIIQKENFFFPKTISKALKKTDKLITEINMSDLVGQMQAITKMVMDSNKTLEDVFSADDYTFIKRVAKDSLNTDIDQFKHFKPIFAQQRLVTESIFGKETKSYELHLMQAALKNEMTMDGLESVSEQMNILDSIPVEVQAKMLLESMKTLSETRRMMDEMVSQYKAQNLDSLYALFEEEEDMSEFQGSLLDNRNRKWIPIIERKIAEMPCFIAVGAGHLGGPNGVINLLRKAGYTVTAVR